MTIIHGFTAQKGNHWMGMTDTSYEGSIPFGVVSNLLDIPLEEISLGDLDGSVKWGGRKAVVNRNNNECMGIFGDGYKIHPYRETLLNGAENFLNGDVQISGVGLTDGGRKAFVQFEMPNILSIPGVGEEFRPGIIAMSSLDGSIATEIRSSITRMACFNQLGAIRKEKGMVSRKVRHTRNSLNRLPSSAEALGLIASIVSDYSDMVSDYAAIDLSDKQWYDFMAEMYPIGDNPTKTGETRAMNQRDALDAVYRSDDRVSPWSGTGWGALQAVNTQWTHLRTLKGEGGNRAERNMEAFMDDKIAKVDGQAITALNRVLVTA